MTTVNNAKWQRAGGGARAIPCAIRKGIPIFFISVSTPKNLFGTKNVPLLAEPPYILHIKQDVG